MICRDQLCTQRANGRIKECGEAARKYLSSATMTFISNFLLPPHSVNPSTEPRTSERCLSRIHILIDQKLNHLDIKGTEAMHGWNQGCRLLVAIIPRLERRKSDPANHISWGWVDVGSK